jgi:hypothetical protein
MLLNAAITQPVQHLLPTRIVEKTVSTQDKQSSRHTRKSTSIFMFYLHSEAEACPRSEEVRHNLGNTGPSWGVPYISESEIRVAPPPSGLELISQIVELPGLGQPFFTQSHPIRHFCTRPRIRIPDDKVEQT